VGVRFLPDAQGVELGLKRHPVDHDRDRPGAGDPSFRRPELVRFVGHDYLIRSLGIG